MKNRTIILIVALVAVLPSAALAQGAQGAQSTEERGAQSSIPFPTGWRPCPRCQNNEDRRQDTVKYKVQSHQFDPHDLTGVWGYDGIGRAFNTPPDLTPSGKQQPDSTFGVESSGYDERPWLDASRPDGGWTHSDEMRVVERYRRVDFGTLESQVTVIDPKTYKEPWVTPKAVTKLVPGAELGEEFCVPS